MNPIIQLVLKNRGILSEQEIENFLNPKYELGDPFLLTDMEKAVQRIVLAIKNQEKIVIYGDYDIDGITASTVLLDGLTAFGAQNIKTYIPNRFTEGYGMNIEAVDKIFEMGCDLIITVDCGSLSHDEIDYANNLGMQTIVTDHHNVAEIQPKAVAVVNPRRPSKYPYNELCGCAVAFKLIQALATKLDGCNENQQKWLLDLVAFGTVCDIMELREENRTFVYYGLKVLAKTRRPGLRALADVSSVDIAKITARDLGFGFGPRMNASGRLKTAELALKLIQTTDSREALDLAEKLDQMNQERKHIQNQIFEEACRYADNDNNDVLIVAGENWNHGVVGIVAAKLLEKYKKPVYCLGIDGETAKGSARSFGDFSVGQAIADTRGEYLIGGGGHHMAAGVTIETKNIEKWRKKVNELYKKQKLNHDEQAKLLNPIADAELDDLENVNLELMDELARLEPFGRGNKTPILSATLKIKSRRTMGDKKQHVKYTMTDGNKTIDLISFGNAEKYYLESGKVKVWFEPTINEWRGRKTIEGYLLNMI